MKSLMAVLIVLLACDVYQIWVYQAWVPKLVYAADTLWINYNIQRDGRLLCMSGERKM